MGLISIQKLRLAWLKKDSVPPGRVTCVVCVESGLLQLEQSGVSVTHSAADFTEKQVPGRSPNSQCLPFVPEPRSRGPLARAACAKARRARLHSRQKDAVGARQCHRPQCPRPRPAPTTAAPPPARLLARPPAAALSVEGGWGCAAGGLVLLQLGHEAVARLVRVQAGAGVGVRVRVRVGVWLGLGLGLRVRARA